MDPRTFPTKGNLILAKNSLALANQGYELMDKKRNILIRELMELIDQAKEDVYKRQMLARDSVSQSGADCSTNSKKLILRGSSRLPVSFPPFSALCSEVYLDLKISSRQNGCIRFQL